LIQKNLKPDVDSEEPAKDTSDKVAISAEKSPLVKPDVDSKEPAKNTSEPPKGQSISAEKSPLLFQLKSLH
jgi:hypothetical protein